MISVHNFIVSTLTWIKNHPWITLASLVGVSVITTGIFVAVLVSALVLVAPLIGTYYLAYLIKTYRYYGSPEFKSIKTKLADKIL